MNGYLPLRPKGTDERGASEYSYWHADQQLSQGGQVSREHEHQPSDRKDNDPNR